MSRSRNGRRRWTGDAEDAFWESLVDAKPDYKTQALCKQVARAVQTALRGLVGDEVLQDLSVVQAEPAPHAGRLMVTLQAGALAGTLRAEDVYERLGRVQGMLRAEVATVVTRKKVPELAFVVVRQPVEAAGEESGEVRRD